MNYLHYLVTRRYHQKLLKFHRCQITLSNLIHFRLGRYLSIRSTKTSSVNDGSKPLMQATCRAVLQTNIIVSQFEMYRTGTQHKNMCTTDFCIFVQVLV